MHRHRLMALALTLSALGLVGCSLSPQPVAPAEPRSTSSVTTGPSGGTGNAEPPTTSLRSSSPRTPANQFSQVLSGPHLRPGSDPSVLPSDVLIADKLNNRLIIVDPQGRIRWQFPRPGDLARGQTFRIPDDAFFTPDGRDIIATQEDDFVVTLIDVARHRIVWRYGKPGTPGHGPDRLWNPDDALVLRDGSVLTADIKNCRLLLIDRGRHRVSRQLGHVGVCRHDPPRTFGSPNGAFPMPNRDYLITEINGDWVDAITLSGRVAWSAHPPGVRYPSDSNQIGPNHFLTADYSRPGQIVIFNRDGKRLWRFAPTGRDALAMPSLALPLPNGDILANDDANHRVIVVDPKTDRIVWQYGVTGKPGTAPGYLDNPDGVDLVPPHSLLVTHRASMGTP